MQCALASHLPLSKQEFSVGKQLHLQKGLVVVHASDQAYRFRALGVINFAERNKLSQEAILEPIDIRSGYQIQPGEHVIIETQEQFDLSDKIGIWFLVERVFYLFGAD